MICHTAGFVLNETVDMIAIVQSLDERPDADERRVDNYIAIPKAAIQKLRRVK